MSLLSKLFGSQEVNGIGLALGGGAVFGAAHVGVLRAVEEKKIKIDYLSGTSIGAFIGALYAFGVKVDDIEKVVLNIDWMDVSNLSLSNFGLLSNAKMGKVISEHIDTDDFNNSKIPFAVIATDISNGGLVIIDSGQVSSAVMASAAIPGVFKPVERDGMLLVDGGIVENVPTTPLKNWNANKIVAVDLNTAHGNSKPENIVQVLMNSFHFMMQNITESKTNAADILICPDLADFNMIDTKKAPELIEKGYEVTMKTFDKKLNN